MPVTWTFDKLKLLTSWLLKVIPQLVAVYFQFCNAYSLVTAPDWHLVQVFLKEISFCNARHDVDFNWGDTLWETENYSTALILDFWHKIYMKKFWKEYPHVLLNLFYLCIKWNVSVNIIWIDHPWHYKSREKRKGYYFIWVLSCNHKALTTWYAMNVDCTWIPDVLHLVIVTAFIWWSCSLPISFHFCQISWKGKNWLFFRARWWMKDWTVLNACWLLNALKTGRIRQKLLIFYHRLAFLLVYSDLLKIQHTGIILKALQFSLHVWHYRAYQNISIWKKDINIEWKTISRVEIMEILKLKWKNDIHGQILSYCLHAISTKRHRTVTWSKFSPLGQMEMHIMLLLFTPRKWEGFISISLRLP